MQINENVTLASFTVFKIGGPARYFCEVKNKDEVAEAIRWAGNKFAGRGAPFFILGAGSNVLISDEGFPGLVIKMNLQEIKMAPPPALPIGKEDRGKEKIIYAAAGVAMAKAVNFTIENGLSGFEWGVGIPGTIGGSVFGNAGCFGGEMKDIVESVEIFNGPNLKNKDCKFSYRSSIFKKHPEWIILGVTLNLKKGNPAESRKKILEYSKERISESTQASGEKGAQEIGAECAGCIFKNPKPDLSAGFLIDTAGLKGKKIGGAMVSVKHGNFIINTGGATAKDVKELIECIKTEVQKKHGVILEEEIRLI